MKGANDLDYDNTQDLLDIEDEDSAPNQEADIIEDQIAAEDIEQTLHLDYTLKTCEERAGLVNKIVEQTPAQNLTNRYLEILGDYIMGGITKEEKKGRQYLTANRLITINKRETSYEGLAEKLENGEDGIYNLITDNKNMFFQLKDPISERDIEEIPGLKELREEIEKVEAACKSARGRRKYLLKKQLIEMRKDQYVLRSSVRQPVVATPCAKGVNKVDLRIEYWLDENGIPQSKGVISFFDPKHISAIMCNYNGLKLAVKDKFSSDFYFLMLDFDELLNKALNDEPIFRDIVQMKFDGVQNINIQKYLLKAYNKTYTVEYISNLWRNKIPKLIAQQAKIDYVIKYYQSHKGARWKKCSCCGVTKPAHTYFYSKNSSSKDGWYSMCKNCRNAKNKK